MPLYFARERPVVERDGSLIMVDDARMQLRPGEKSKCVGCDFARWDVARLTAGIENRAHTT